MFEAFGFSGDHPTLQKFISATFEQPLWWLSSLLSEFPFPLPLGHSPSIADLLSPGFQVGQCVDSYAVIYLYCTRVWVFDLCVTLVQ